MKGIKSFRRTFLLIAALYLARGISLLVWPAQSGFAVCYVFVGVSLLYGAVQIIRYCCNAAQGALHQRGVGAGHLCGTCQRAVLTYWVKKAKRGLEAIYDDARCEAASIKGEGRIQDEPAP